MQSLLPDQKLTPAGVEPLDVREFSALMENFVPFASRMALAVSGGPDSMALAFCIKRWCEEKTGNDIVAFIVDHDLRAGSAAEALKTQKELARIGIPAEILHWQHPQVVARLHEVARRARYELLCDACHRQDRHDLLLAHQREDQAETILMRLAKGSGIDGLAGMPAQSMKDGVRILRPFLAIQKERLVATCETAGLSFVSDPSNASPKFARGRLRRVLPLLAAEGLTIERLCDLGARAGEARAALDHATNMFLRVATQLDDGGLMHIDLEHLRPVPRAIGLRALAMCLQVVHSADYPPEHASLTRLFNALAADAEMPATTLRGCLIGKNRFSVSIMREVAAITDEQPITPGASLIWDQRWRISLSSRASQNFIVRPLGNPPYETLDRLAPGLRAQIPQGRVRATLPSLWFNGELALIPALPQAKYASPADAVLGANWPPSPGR